MSTGIDISTDWELKELQAEHRRNKKFPPEMVRKRKSYAFWVEMIKQFATNQNSPEENARILYRELSYSGGYFTRKGALMQYKLESMEQAINDFKQNKQCPKPILAPTGTSDTQTL